MKASELRIGNLVLYENPHGDRAITTVNEETFKFTYNLDPIPLTEEWLLQFGFKQMGFISFLGTKYFRFTLGRNGAYSVDNKTYIYKVNEHDLCEIKYVHQLQNIYFALTEEELTRCEV